MQILSVYIQLFPLDTPTAREPLRILELGAGTGLLSLTLASQHHEVVATDISSVLTLLERNIEHNKPKLPSGGNNITVQALDWTQHQWRDPIDVVVTSDTVYEPSLFRPLLDTLRKVSNNPPIHDGVDSSATPTPVILGLERRDPLAVEQFFEMAVSDGWQPRQINRDCLERCGRALGWTEEDWDGVELWTLYFDPARIN